MPQTLKLVQKMIEDTNAQITTEPANSGKPLLYAGAVEKAQISIYNEDCLQALLKLPNDYSDGYLWKFVIGEDPFRIDNHIYTLVSIEDVLSPNLMLHIK